jgi:putative transposase
MANTFSCLNIHCVFSTKERVQVLNPDIRERLWPYMGGIAKQNGMIPKCIGGVSDHVHLLVALPTRLAIAKAVQLIKAGSSAWIHQTFPNLRNFAWQQGYGAFSVGISQVQETVHYIEQQLEHHRTRTFQEEYLAFLKKHGVHFEEKYLWDTLGLTPPRSYRTLRDGSFEGRFPGTSCQATISGVPTGHSEKSKISPGLTVSKCPNCRK